MSLKIRYNRIFTLALFLLLSCNISAQNISWSQSQLNFNVGNVDEGVTSLMFGPDDRLYVAEYTGAIKILTIQRNGATDYTVLNEETLNGILTMADHNDDGTSFSSTERETIGLTVVGTANNPVIYVTSSDFRIGAGNGGGNGDIGLDTNSGVITRFSWNGSSWDVVDIVRGLPRSEENHATNGLEFITINGTDYLIVAQGGHTNAGSPSTNFVYTCEYALSAAILAVNLSALESMPILDDNGRSYIYDLPTLDDPTRENVHADGSAASEDPDDPNYSPFDINDPWGGNDGLNQAMLVVGGPVQILSPGYRNAYDLVVTESGALYVTDNGANGGWGGLPMNEGGGSATNDYDPNEPGSNDDFVYGEEINNADHLQLITTDLQTYDFSNLPITFFGGHPNPTRANPTGAGLYTVDDDSNSVFRTLKYDPDGTTTNSTTNANIALPVNWPPVPVSETNSIEGDWRGPGMENPDGPNDNPVTTWNTNTNGIDEYTATNFGGMMQGNLLAGANNGAIRRVQLDANGTLETDGLNSNFMSGIGGNALGITCNSDTDVFPGSVWAGTLNGKIVVFEPTDFSNCLEPNDPLYDANADYDSDGYLNYDEEDNNSEICNGGSQPLGDFDKQMGGQLVSDLNDNDDDFDNIPDAFDPFQLGDPTINGSDAFTIPVSNGLFNDQQSLGGIFGLGLTGLMNNGDTGANWLLWLDRIDDLNDPNPNDVLGGAPGLMTSHMTSGTALGISNTQEKGYQLGIQIDNGSGVVTITGGMVGFNGPLGLYNHPNATSGELGFFIGDGTQSNYIKFVATPNGFTGLQEISDNVRPNPISYNLPTTDRPSNGIKFIFEIDTNIGEVTFKFQIDSDPIITAGTLLAEDPILQAIQNAGTDLAVGFIGTSNSIGYEIEGTWDYLNVSSEKPFIVQNLQDLEREPGALDDVFDLNNYFNDNDGTTNLTYTIESNTNPNITASISNNSLTLSYPSENQTGAITIRATDLSGYFVEDTFNCAVTSTPTALFRINAGGPEITHGGEVFSIDANFTGGKVFTNTSATVSPLFQTERSANPPTFSYDFPLPNGTYTLNLYFADIFFGATGGGSGGIGSRVFDVDAEGVKLLDDYDIYADVGPQTEVIKTFTVDVTDGTLNILFDAEGADGVDEPKVSAIEILGTSPYPAITVDPIVAQTNNTGDTIGSLGVNASGGNPNANFTYSIVNQPSGIDIEPTNGLIYGTIDPSALTGGANNDGIHNVTVTVDKPGSSSVTIDFSWTITGPFTIDDITDRTDGISSNVTFFANAFGGDINQPINYSITGQPLGITINTVTGEISGTIDANAINGGTNSDGIHDVQVTASRSGSADAQDLFVWTITDEPVPTALFRINAGGPEITYNGEIFSADANFIGGKIFENTSATVSTMFQTERSANPPTFEYAFSVPNGDYEVILHFAELFFGATGGGSGGIGSRVFDVQGEGITLLDDYDINADVGPETEVSKIFSVSVADGELNLLFDAEGGDGVDEPKISAIEILSASQYPLIVIDPIANQNNLVNDVISTLGVIATGGNPSENFTYAISGEPDGIVIEPNTGVISGVISSNAVIGGTNNDGIHQVTVTVSKPDSNNAQEQFTWIVSDILSCTWHDLADSNINRFQSRNEIIGDKIYVMGGWLQGINSSNDLDIYDITNDTWSTGADLLLNTTHMGSIVVGDEIWLLGGFEGNIVNSPSLLTEKVQIYNTMTNSWSYGPDLPKPIGSGSAVVNNNKIHFIGGLDVDIETDIPDHYVLDLNNIPAGWTTAAPMPRPRNHHSTESINGIIYTIGGQEGHNFSKNDIAYMESYDPNTDSWTILADLPIARSHFESGTLVHNDKIIIVGGQQQTSSFSDDVTQYDPQLNQWTELCNLPNNRMSPMAQAYGDQLIVSGGGINGTSNLIPTTQWLQLSPSASDISINEIANQVNQSGDNVGIIQVVASGGNPSVNFSYSISGQPDGVTIDFSSGEISGLVNSSALAGGPNSDGLHFVTIVVSKSGSSDAQFNFTWNITDLIWHAKGEVENYTERHECSFVHVGDKFALIGGRESNDVDVFDYNLGIWNPAVSTSPSTLNHFQGVYYQGYVWAIGAFVGGNSVFPNDPIADHVWLFETATNQWIQGPEIPQSRKRGSTGLVMYNDKFYIIGGNMMGHSGGFVPWFDEYDPQTGNWTTLTDAPNARDHFQATLVGDKIYMIGGAQTNQPISTFVAEVDVYNFITGTWSTLSDKELPTLRDGASTAVFNNDIIVMGGGQEDDTVDGVFVKGTREITEAFDVDTETWYKMPDMNFGHRATQAIVSGNGIHILAGQSSVGGSHGNMEYYGTDNPVGTPITPSELLGPSQVDFSFQSNQNVLLEVLNGDTAIFVRSIEISGPDAADFSIQSGNLTNVLLKSNTSQSILVDFIGTGTDKNATLTINYNASSTLNIPLNAAGLSCTWNSLADADVERFQSRSEILGDKIYVMGGWTQNIISSDKLEIYDVTNDTWSYGADLLLPVTHMGSVVVNNQIWLIGGFLGDFANGGSVTLTDQVQVYDIATNTWSPGLSLPKPIGSGAATLNGNKIHFMGGLESDIITDIGDHYILDLNNIGAGWQTLASLPNARNHVSAETVNGTVYAIGGQTGHSGPHQDVAFVEAYNSNTDTWTSVANLPIARSHFESGTLVYNGKIIIVGGQEQSTNFSDDITQYDPQLNQWTELCNLPNNRMSPMAQAYGDQLIVSGGGINGTSNLIPTTEWLQLEPVISQHPPIVVDAIADQNHTVGDDIGSLAVMASGGDPNANFSYSITGQPEGLSINANTGVITGLIAAGAQTGGINGVHDVTVKTSKLGSTSVDTNFSWTVTGSFTIDDITDKTNTTGSNVSFFANAYGGDINQPISYSITGQPSGVSINTATGEISGTIDASAINGGSNSDGIHNVQVTASRSGSTDVQDQFVWTIEDLPANDLPWLEDFEDLANGTTVDNGDTAWTSNRDAGTFQVTNGAFLTSGNSNTIANWTSELININGTVNVSVDVDDLDNSKEPVDFIRAFYIVDGGSPIQFGSATGNITAQTFSATNITGATIQIVVEADVSTTNEFYIFDNVGVVGVVQIPPIVVDAIADQNHVVGDDIGSVAVIASGGDPNANFSYSITGQPDGLSINANTGVITGVIASGASNGGINGIHAVTVTTSKLGSTSVDTNFSWTVTGPFTIDDITDKTNTTGSNVSFFANAYGGDINQPISYSITGQPSGVSINTATGEISGTIDASAINGGSNSDGIHNVQVTASRSGSTDVQDQFVWTIEDLPANDLPWLEDFEDLANGTTVDNGDTAWTSNRDAGTFQVTNGAFLTSGNSNTIANWTSELININGTVNVSVDVDDLDNSKEPVDFIRAFYIVDGGSPIQFGSATGNITAQTFSATNITGATIQIVVEADVSTTNEFYIFDNVGVVGVVQIPPIVVDAIADQNHVVGDDIGSVAVVASGGDPNANFSYSITGQPDGLSINANTGVITGVIASGASNGGINGVHAVTVTTSKLGSTSVDTNFSWTVTGPFTIDDITDKTNTTGSNVSFFANAYGGDINQPISYSITGQPSGVSINTATGEISGTIDASAINGGSNSDGIHNVQVTASRSGSTDVQDLFVWTIEDLPANDLPWLEDFNDLANGTTVDNGDTAWTSNRDAGTFQVTNGAFLTSGNSNTIANWTSELININGTVNISVDVDDLDAVKEPVDFIRAFYIVDGGSPIQFGSATGNIAAQTFSATNITGATIQIVVEADVSTTNEFYIFDNVSVFENLVAKQSNTRSTTLSFEDKNEDITNNFTIYPNPTSDFVYVQIKSSSENVSEFYLYDIYGRLIKKYSNLENSNLRQQLDVTELQSGIYSLYFLSKGRIVHVSRLLIKN